MSNDCLKDLYIVYMHTTPSDKKYIGITKNKPNRRWVNGFGYHNNILFYRAIKKYGWDNIKSEILYQGLIKSEAEQREIELISQHKTNNPTYGYNVANGGNTIGTMSQGTKDKISKAKKGKTHNSSETRKKMSMAKIGKPLPKDVVEKMRVSRTGKKRTQETRERMRLAQIGNRNRRSPVSQYDMNGNFIKTWDAISDAQRTLNIDVSHISKCCRNKLKSAGGFTWKYANGI
jgi:group I intron endonuclease